MVNRKKLLEKLEMNNVDLQLIWSIRALLNGTTALVNEETIDIKKGVQQGGCLSPQLFTCYINDLMVDLNSFNAGKIQAYAYADDIIVSIQGWNLL